VANAIVTRAAMHLAETGLSVLVEGVPQRLALTGGLAEDALLAASFLDRVRTVRPDLEATVGGPAPLAGAAVLARAAAAGAALLDHPPYLTNHPSDHQGAS
jgi:hypothetical protein